MRSTVQGSEREADPKLGALSGEASIHEIGQGPLDGSGNGGEVPARKDGLLVGANEELLPANRGIPRRQFRG
jgi:guanyl-specific ribonuclease Sa